MRQLLYGVVAAGLLGLFGSHGHAGGKLVGTPAGTSVAKKGADDGASCGSFGTSVEFVSTPSAAAKQADKEHKLVFVLHVSGNFETPEFT